MAPVEQHTIALDDGKTFYHPGDEIRGRVLLRLSGAMTIRSISVGFHGEGHVTHRSGRTRYNYTQPYFHYACLVYDCNNESANHQFRGNFPPGEYWFPFAFRLPPVNLPTSYYDNTASVQYWVDSMIDRPMWFNKKTAVSIFVLEAVNADTQELQHSQTKQNEMPICCCCCRGGKVNVSGKIIKGGFYPGEVIETKFFVENQSNREVTYTELVLKQKLRKIYGEDHSYDYVTRTNVIASIKGVGVPTGQDADINNLKLVVPNNVAPTTTCEESIVAVKYMVELIAHTKGTCVCAASVEFPVTIGFMPSQPSDWSRQVLQAIAQLVNSQLEQQAQEERQQQVGNDDQSNHSDRAMLIQGENC